MTKEQKKVFIVLLVISVVIAAIYFVFVKVIDFTKTKQNTDSGSENTGTVSNTTQSEFPLQKGSRGDKVKTLQRWINSQAKAMEVFDTNVLNVPLVVDGVFGSKTDSALSYISKYGWMGSNVTAKEIYPVSEIFYYTTVAPMKTLTTIMGLEKQNIDLVSTLYKK